jgi:tripartite-type tricarboxylate transporter receptor subunit TctC
MKTSVRQIATPQHWSPLRANPGRIRPPSSCRHPRRRFLRLAASAAALPAVSRITWAQAYPSRPVRIVVGFPAGGGTDILARLIGQWLSERLHQSFVIENRPGANTNIAIETVARATPDGHTLGMVGTGAAINATLYEHLNYNLVRDIAPVASIARGALVVVVNPSFPAQSLPEFIAYAKANPGKVNMASAGTGSLPHMAGELLKLMTGINMLHVPYRGDAPALTDLLGGQVQLYFSTLAASIGYIRAGKLRGLAVTTATRSEALPEMPAVSEFVSGYEASVINGFGAPKGTPIENVDRLNVEINAALADPVIKARFADFGSAPMVMTPGDFGRFIATETEKWAKVVKFAGARAE